MRDIACNILKNSCNNIKHNLHLVKKDKKIKDKRYIWLRKQLNKKLHFSSVQKCLNLAIKLYEKGYHIFDLIQFIEKEVTLTDKYFYLVYFDRIRIEYRNEILLMFNQIKTFLVENREKYERRRAREAEAKVKAAAAVKKAAAKKNKSPMKAKK